MTTPNDCQHEPILPEPEPFVDARTLPGPGRSSYTYCKHCGVPMQLPRNPTRRITIWGWREMMGFDPYDNTKWPDEYESDTGIVRRDDAKRRERQ